MPSMAFYSSWGTLPVSKVFPNVETLNLRYGRVRYSSSSRAEDSETNDETAGRSLSPPSIVDPDYLEAGACRIDKDRAPWRRAGREGHKIRARPTVG